MQSNYLFVLLLVFSVLAVTLFLSAIVVGIITNSLPTTRRQGNKWQFLNRPDSRNALASWQLPGIFMLISRNLKSIACT